MTVSQRNTLVEEYLWCIDSVISQNKPLLVSAHLDQDDVYQALALRLIQAVERYNIAKGPNMKLQIFEQLKCELFRCTGPQAKYGLTNVPYHLRDAVVPIDSMAVATPSWERRFAA